MRNMKNYRSVAGLVFAAALTACVGEKNAVQELTAANPVSAIRFFNFSVGAPSVNFYANDMKMTAIVSTNGSESTVGTAYGAVGSGGYYSGIAPGQYTLAGKISATTDKDRPISTLAVPIANGKYYSYYLSGFYNTTTKTTESFIVEDVLPAMDFSVAYVRFVNAISNSSPMVLSVKNQTSGVVTVIGSGVGYKSASTFVALPVGLYDIGTRVPGAVADAITRIDVSFSPGSVYTIGARGDMTVTSATATTRPILDNTANR